MGFSIRELDREMMDYFREETAYHEAGHFVAMALIREMPGLISIEPNDEGLGYVSRMGSHRSAVMLLTDFSDAFVKDFAIKEADTNAFLLAAGGVAAQIYLGTLDTEQPLTATGTLEDDFNAYEVYEWLDIHDDPYERYDEVKQWTRHIFTDEIVWAAIEYVARALLEKGSFDEDAAGDLYLEGVRMLEGKTAPPHFENLQKRYPLPTAEANKVHSDD